MELRRFLGIALLAGALSVAVASVGRGEIPAEIITATSALAPAQQQAIDAEVKHFTGQLLGGTDVQVIEARSRLLDPLLKGASQIFRVAYSASVAATLPKALESDRPIVRINAMIVASKLTDPTVAKLVEKGLHDPNPAVRYWSAKAIHQIAPALNGEVQKDMLGTLSVAVGKETSPDALQQQLTAMDKLNIPEAVTRELEALNERTIAHAKDARLVMLADTEALRQLYVKLVQDKSNGKTVTDGVMRQLALVSYRYLAVTAEELDGGKLSSERQGEDWLMANTSDIALRWAASQLAPKATLPAEIKDFIAARNPAGVKLRNEEWKQLLLNPPLSYRRDELDLTPAK